MNRLAYTCVSLAALVAAVGIATPATAQTRDTRVADSTPSAETKKKAKRFVDAGLVHQEQGEYEEAIRWFRKAYELIPHPQLLYNIGLAHRMAGHRQSAMDYFRQYLDRDPEGQWREEARTAITEIEAELADGVDPEEEARVKFDELHAAVAADLGALESIAGRDAATSLRDRYEDIDAAQVRIREGQRRAASKQLRALRGDIREARTRAEREVQSGGTSQAPGSPGNGSGQANVIDNPKSAGGGARVAGWVLMGIGTAALAAGAVSGLQARSIAGDLSRTDNFEPWTPEDLARDEEGRAAGQRAVIFAGVGGVAIVAGLIAYLSGRSALKRQRRALMWSPSARDGQFGVTLSGAF